MRFNIIRGLVLAAIMSASTAYAGFEEGKAAFM
jgi:hypothetical protein